MKWKKFLVCMCALVGTFSVGYAYYSREMKAASVSTQYYRPGDVFERSNKNSFEMKGVEWKIIYTDNASGKGYIASENLGTKYSCNYNLAGEIYESEMQPCMTKVQGVYGSANTTEANGKFIEGMNTGTNLSILRLMTLPEYNAITSNETDNTAISNLTSIIDKSSNFWLDAYADNGIRVLFYFAHGGAVAGGVQYKHLVLGTSTASTLHTVMEINLPQKES